MPSSVVLWQVHDSTPVDGGPLLTPPQVVQNSRLQESHVVSLTIPSSQHGQVPVNPVGIFVSPKNLA